MLKRLAGLVLAVISARSIMRMLGQRRQRRSGGILRMLDLGAMGGRLLALVGRALR